MENTHTHLFKFNLLGSEFDVRPLFDVLDYTGSEGMAAILDTFISDLIMHLPSESFTDGQKNDLWHLRELRDAILKGGGGPELVKWKRSIDPEESRKQRLLQDHELLANRLNSSL